MNFIESWFRRRGLQRLETSEEKLPPSLRSVPPGTVVGIHGYNFRVVHRRCGRNGRNPGLVLAPIGPTRKRLKERQSLLRSILRRKRVA